MCNFKFLQHDRSIDRQLHEACDRIGFQFGLDLPNLYVYISQSIPQSSLPSIFVLIRRRCGQTNRRLFQLSFIHHITEHRAREPCGIHEILFAIVFVVFCYCCCSFEFAYLYKVFTRKLSSFYHANFAIEMRKLLTDSTLVVLVVVLSGTRESFLGGCQNSCRRLFSSQFFVVVRIVQFSRIRFFYFLLFRH